MSIINVMWSSGAPFSSVHKVHQQIISQLDPAVDIKTWFLQGEVSGCAEPVSQVREWRLSSRLLKERHVWRLLRPVLQYRMRKALVESGAKVVLLDGLGVARVLLPILKDLPGIRVVVVFHGATKMRDVQRLMFQQFPKDRMTLAAVSQTLAISLEKMLDIPVIALRSALEPESFCQRLLARKQARRVLDLPSESMRILGAVGRLVTDKGFDYLLDAFSQSLVRHPDLNLVIIGEGPDRGALERKIKQLKLDGKVFLPGHKPGLAKLYRGFDWVVIPSREEGLGLVLQEAVIAGIPVLVSDLDVFREQLGDAGHYVPVADVPAWVAAIEQFTAQEGDDVSASQHRALAPEKAWEQFRTDSRALLTSHP
jgi:glycosyltransferase involved in cell wall biosynthesis